MTWALSLYLVIFVVPTGHMAEATWLEYSKYSNVFTESLYMILSFHKYHMATPSLPQARVHEFPSRYCLSLPIHLRHNHIALVSGLLAVTKHPGKQYKKSLFCFSLRNYPSWQERQQEQEAAGVHHQEAERDKWWCSDDFSLFYSSRNPHLHPQCCNDQDRSSGFN